MMVDTLDRLKALFDEFPIMRATSVPTLDEVDDASQRLGVPFPSDYKEFLLQFGGAMIGPYPIFGLRPVEVMETNRWSVTEVTLQYRDNRMARCGEWVVISEDHSGNPVSFDRDGIVWIYDHDFGGISKLANRLEEYIRTVCLKLPRVV